MKILVLVANLEVPPRQGMQQSCMTTMDSVIASADEVEIVCWTNFEVDREALIARYGEKVRRLRLFRWVPGYQRQLLQMFALAPRLWWQGWLREAASRADAILSVGIVLFPLTFILPRKKQIWSIVDAYSLRMKRRGALPGTGRMRRLAFALAARWLAAIEWVGARRARAVHVVSGADRRYLESQGVARVRDIPIGRPDAAARETVAGAAVINFTGSLDQDYIVDSLIWFYDLVFCALPQPGLMLEICAGSSRPMNLPARILNDPRVRILGWIDDYNEVLRRSRLAVMPDLCGTGIKNRVLDAARSGVPCVASPLAAEGTAFVDGRSISIASEPAGFTAAVSRLIDDETWNWEMGRQAKAVFMENYELERVQRSWARLCGEVAAIGRDVLRGHP